MKSSRVQKLQAQLTYHNHSFQVAQSVIQMTFDQAMQVIDNKQTDSMIKPHATRQCFSVCQRIGEIKFISQDKNQTPNFDLDNQEPQSCGMDKLMPQSQKIIIKPAQITVKSQQSLPSSRSLNSTRRKTHDTQNSFITQQIYEHEPDQMRLKYKAYEQECTLVVEAREQARLKAIRALTESHGLTQSQSNNNGTIRNKITSNFPFTTDYEGHKIFIKQPDRIQPNPTSVVLTQLKVPKKMGIVLKSKQRKHAVLEDTFESTHSSSSSSAKSQQSVQSYSSQKQMGYDSAKGKFQQRKNLGVTELGRSVSIQKLRPQVNYKEIRYQRVDTSKFDSERGDILSRLGHYPSALTLIRSGINPERLIKSPSNVEISLMCPSSISNLRKARIEQNKIRINCYEQLLLDYNDPITQNIKNAYGNRSLSQMQQSTNRHSYCSLPQIASNSKISISGKLDNQSTVTRNLQTPQIQRTNNYATHQKSKIWSLRK